MDDQGLQWWQQLGAHEVSEFMDWLDDLEKRNETAEFERDFEREERLIRSVENE